jgi:hypothetical protein
VTVRTTECATGCTIRGQHLPSCDGTCPGCRRSVEQPHKLNKDGTWRCGNVCGGCLPRPAARGVLCHWCAQRFASDLATAPALVRHLRLMAHPTAGVKPQSEVATGGDASQASVLSRAVTDADDLHALIAKFAAEWVDAHPGSSGPDESWSRRTRQTLSGNEYGQWVVRSRVVGIRDAVATELLVGWLLPHFEWLTEQPWAGEARAELSELTASLNARWPTDDTRERPIPGIPCPRCDHVALTYTPASWYRAPFKVVCQNPECGRPFSEDEWERLVALHTARSPR